MCFKDIWETDKSSGKLKTMWSFIVMQVLSTKLVTRLYREIHASALTMHHSNQCVNASCIPGWDQRYRYSQQVSCKQQFIWSAILFLYICTVGIVRWRRKAVTRLEELLTYLPGAQGKYSSAGSKAFLLTRIEFKSTSGEQKKGWKRANNLLSTPLDMR